MKQSRFSSYIELTKPRIGVMVLVTAAMGYFLGGKGVQDWGVFIVLLVGTFLSSSGASALNNYLERDADKLMHRTMHRPIPSGVIQPHHARLFGIALSLIGTILLAVMINLLTAFLALLTVFLYVFLYTPLKRTTTLNTIIGAIPGAIPPLGGWAAATGSLSLGAWTLFLILFLWQHPHFYAIAWICRDDYARGGFKMLPVFDPDGRKTVTQILLFSLLLIPISIVPTLIGMSGWIYFFGALLLGIGMLHGGMALAITRSNANARYVLHASLVYLPALLALIVFDRTF